MTEYSNVEEEVGIASNQNLIKGDLMSSILPLLIGIPAGLFSSILNNNYTDRGYLSPEYYFGVAFEFQLLVFFSLLFGIPLFFLESKRFQASFKEMLIGSLICNFICFLMAYGHGYFPLLLMFYLQWLWMCYFWQKKFIPAFRYAIWLSLGLLCGAIAGSIIHLSIF